MAFFLNGLSYIWPQNSDKLKNNTKHLQLIITGLVLVILVLVTFRKAFDNSFVDFDDFTYVVNNDLVRNPETSTGDIFRTPVSSNYHPLTILSMRMNNNECRNCPNGISSAPFIRTNIIIHVFNTILVLLLVFLLSEGNLAVAGITAVLFGIHPMHVESVAWISERKDVLYSFFFLSALLAYIKSITSRFKFSWLAVSFLLFIFSCLSKATAVVLPLVFLLINYWYAKAEGDASFKSFINKLFPGKTAFYLIPFFFVSVFTGLIAYNLQNGQNFLGILELDKVNPDVVDAAGPFTLWQKLMTGCYGIIFYIFKFFVPIRLAAFYPYPGTSELQSSTISIIRAISPIAVLVIAIAVLFSMKKTRLFFFGMGFFLVTVILVLQIIPVGYAITADRYSYLPYIGIAFIVATSAVKYSGKRKTVYIIAGIYIVILMFIAGRQADVWNNTEKLWTNVIDKFPRVEIAHRSRAKYYSKAAFAAKSASERKILEDKAMADFSEAIKSGSRNSEVYEGMGVIYGSKGEKESAVKYFNAALKLDPENGSIYYNRAITFANMDRKQEAIDDYSSALKYSPDNPVRILTNRSNLLLETGRFAEAIKDLDELIMLDNRNFILYYNRAFSKQKLNDYYGALADFEKAQQLNPEDKVTMAQIMILKAYLKVR